MNAEVGRKVSFKRVHGSFSHCNKVNHANFEDPNLDVPYPILTIHGNHDDPTGPQAQSVCEKLATCGLLNYFGALDVTKTIHVEPIILQKGKLKIALYGMGFIPDYKLKMAFDKGEVTFAKPPKDSFNVLVVHQNRIPLNKTRYIPDEYYPKYFHLIIRGHEHASQEPTKLAESDVNGMVFQPGSTVATSISAMEAGPKQVAIVTIRLNQAEHNNNPANLYKTEYDIIKLKSCRPMILKDISQKELFRSIKESYGSSKITSAVFKRFSKEFVEKKCEELLEPIGSQSVPSSTSTKCSNSSSKKTNAIAPGLPILRIRLEYAVKNERFDDMEISSKFYPTRVANKDIVLFKKQKIVKSKVDGQSENETFDPKFDDEDNDDDDDEFDFVNLGEEKRETIDLMIEGYFKDKPIDEQLTALSISEYINAVRGSNEDGNVISKVINKKKQLILSKYKTVISNQGKVNLYQDQTMVEKWFQGEFSKENIQDPAAGDPFDDLMEL